MLLTAFARPATLLRHYPARLLPRWSRATFTSQADNAVPAPVRSPAEIATRSACLQLVLARWGMEMALKMGHGNANLSGHEKLLMLKEDGEWNLEDLHCHGHWESLGILLWTLARVKDIPPYYEMFSRPQLFNATGIQPAKPITIHNFISSAEQHYQPRPTAQFHEAVNKAEAWYWRAHAQRLLQTREQLGLDGENPSGSDPSAPSSTSAPEPASASTRLESSPTMAANPTERTRLPRSFLKFLKGLPHAIDQASDLALEHHFIAAKTDGDFGVESGALYGNLGHPQHNIPLNDDGSAMEIPPTWMPYKQIDDSGHFLLSDIAQHRMLAFGWLAGRVTDWDTDKTQLPNVNPVSSLWAPFNELEVEKGEGEDKE
ncbi:hypothetical protein H4R33_004846 [Dimargaris cristalligena]|nr:hypothetical protein H4R33_004846 [Dimargaris cristalligena]